MAHVVGVPKRDPCRKCELPVFLAERLMVGKKVYHRTCLKCARCGYQLTPGSFYETEIDEQYCCETCPDEELNQNSVEQDIINDEVTEEAICLNVDLGNILKRETTSTNVLQSPTRSVRSSIKERLAFFENQRNDDGDSGKQLLQKSLSDEEKSKSLQRIESSSGTVEVSYKPKISVSNYLINTADSEESASEPSFSIQESKVESSDSEDDTDTNMSLPPELPKSLPPLTELNIEKKLEERKQFSVSAQLQLSSSTIATTPKNVDQQENFVLESANKNATSELKINLSNEIATSNNNINDEELPDIASLKSAYSAEEKTDKQTDQLNPIKLEHNLEFSDKDCVTKDKYAFELTIQTTADNLQEILCRKDPTHICINQSSEIQTISDSETIEENIAELRTSNQEISNISLHLENTETTDRHIVGHAHLQQYEVITNNEKKEKVEELPSEQLRENIVECEIATNSTHIACTLIKNETETDEKTTLFSKNELETEIVPSTNRAKDNEILDCNLGDKKEHLETNCSTLENLDNAKTPETDNSKTNIKDYPDDLNPFKSDDEELPENNKENVELRKRYTMSSKKGNSNPFDSSDDDVELEKAQKSRSSIISTPKVPPPRPPPPRISKNPFGSDDEDETSTQKFSRRSSLTGSQNRKTPVPTPRSNISQSQNPTPEATPRLSTKVNTTISHSASTTPNNSSLPILQNSSEFYGSANSLYSNILRNSDVRSSNNSLNLSAGGTIRSRKSRRAPLPPAPVRELFPSNETINTSSKTSTPSSSTVGTPKSARKKRPAPAPPKPARQVLQVHDNAASTQSKNLDNYPLQSELNSKLSDEEKALLEGKTSQSMHKEADLSLSSRQCSKRLIPLDKELIEEHGSLQYVEKSNSQCDDLKQQNQHKSLTLHEEEPNVVYRRVLVPLNLETPTHEHNPLIEDLSKSPSLGGRQMEKLKDNKEANNRNRQSQISVTSSGADDNDPLFNKSAHGKWKRRKGPAPALPIPPRKVLQMLPLQEIKHELEIIEVQQQGLEKQGVILEKMIRDRCEGENGEPLITSETADSASGSSVVENSKEVENLILQLFELVNEKNELFRRQAELMYLRRQHRLEQEQADLEYEIRVLMAQPERNKTDSDKAREEALIERLVEVVQLRNEVVECLEMDRLREAEEDQSIKTRLESHIAKRDEDSNAKRTLTKLSKKEKKKQKEAKKLFKSKKLDADKDADESEVNVDKPKRKKKLLIF